MTSWIRKVLRRMMSDPSLDAEETPEEELGRKLSKLWSDQIKFNIAVGELDYKSRTSEEMVQVYLLGLMSEMDELLKGLNWKSHRKQNKPPLDKVALADHLADIGKYTMCLWQLFGFTPDTMVEAMQKKTDALWHVLGSEFSEPRPGQPVLLVDLDNTVARYIEGFSTWMAGTGHPARHRSNEWSNYELAPLFNLDWSHYQSLKLLWEQGTRNGRGEPGGYATLDPYDAWTDAVKHVARSGAYVILCTARPQEGAKQVWYDCWSWAVAHFGRVDRLAFCGPSRVEIATRYRDAGHPVVWLDDQHIHLMIEYKIPSIIHTQPYNRKEAIEASDNNDHIAVLGDDALKYAHLRGAIDEQQRQQSSGQGIRDASDTANPFFRPYGKG